MFKSNPQSNEFIPVTQVQIPPEAQVDYNSDTQTQIRFLVPTYIGYMDPRTSRFQYQVTMSGRGKPQPNPRAGISSLIRDWRIEDGMAQSTLEEVLDSNVLTAQTWGYSQNASITHKRTMFEGQSLTPEVGDSTYWTGGAVGNDWNAAPITVANDPAAKTLQIQHTLYNSGLLGDGQDAKCFPLVATKGLRLQLNLENAQRACTFQTGNLGIGKTGREGEQLCALGTALLLAGDPKVALDTTFPIMVLGVAEALAAGTGHTGVNKQTLGLPNNNPFSIGDALWAGTDGAANEEKLGIITEMTVDGGTGQLVLRVCPDRALQSGWGYAHPVGDSLFVRSEDRVNGYPASADIPVEFHAAMAQKLNYTLSNVEYLVSQVRPPSQYVEAMLNQVNGKGLTIDFRCWSTYRNTLSALNGLTTNWIPTESTRVYSCLSTPLGQNNQLSIENDSFKPLTNGARNYTYSWGNSLYPNRPVHLERNSQTIPKPNALALIELEKCLVNAGIPVRDLQRSTDRFNIGRAFSKYGGTTSLQGQTLSLRIEYQNAVDRLMINNYVHSLRRLTIRQGSIQAY